ncbi:MAG: HAMP domain-containing protein [Acidiferrobacterales bacterium]|nr:HAMP domain-containing protein [Acidiferrobacterales bacterium]
MNSISVKLFLALFGLTSLVLLAGLGLARWSLNYGFHDYLNSIQEQRLGVISEQLIVHYRQSGRVWNFQTEKVFTALVDPRTYDNAPANSSLYVSEIDPYQALRNQSLEEDLAQLAHLDQIISPSGLNEFPTPMGMGMGPPVPTVGSLRDTTINPDDAASNISARVMVAESPLGMGQDPSQPPRRGPPITPTALYDANGNELAATAHFLRNAEMVVNPIEVDGVIVGELRAIATPEFDSPSENAFIAQQQLAGVAIILGSLLLTAIASLFLSRMMVKPIVKIKDGIGELADGDYQLNMTVDRKDELGLLMKDVNKLGSILEKNRLSRRNFIADISHELRTPVTILGGEIEAIKDGMRNLSMNSVESLAQETGRLKHLIDDLSQLSLSDIGGLRYEFKKLDLADIIQSTAEKYQARIAAAGLSLDLNLKGEYVIRADEQRLTQLFINLLNNAVAYTDSPGEIKIRVENHQSAVIVYFEDSSPSLTKDEMAKMFEPMFRAEESRNRRAGGAGLGLTISRNIVAAHDASIEASTSELGGVLFKVTFPSIKKK